MLKRLAVLFAERFLCYAKPVPDEPASQEVKTEPEQHRTDPEPIIPPLPPNEPNTANAEPVSVQHVENDVKSLKERLKAADRWMICLTLAIALFALCQVVAAILQWRTMDGQLREMKGSGEQTDTLLCLYRQQLTQMRIQTANSHDLDVGTLTQAAAVTRAEAAQVKVERQSIRFQFPVGKPMIVGVELANIGATSALNFRIQGILEILDKDKEPDFRYPGNPDPHDLQVGFLASGEPIHWAVTSWDGKEKRVFTIDDEARMQASTAYAVVYGRMTYGDIFGKSHWETFCVASSAPKPWTIDHTKCAAYDRVDSEPVVQETPKPLAPTQEVPDKPCELPKPN